jgi:hypothetical protein
MSSVVIQDQVLMYVRGEGEELRVDGGETESLTGLNIREEVSRWGSKLNSISSEARIIS